LQPLSEIFLPADNPSLLVGLSTPDDSAVYRLDSERAIISTMDFFPPVVDDAFDFGAIAAANALSDVYAMGGEPLMAINLVAYPDGYGMAMLKEILRGGAEKVFEAGAVIAGGHTVTDKEPKYGLAVTGIVAPDKIISKQGARPGDSLILTKPLGTGTITTALKNQVADEEHVAAAVASMSRLNRNAARLAQTAGIHAMTDITGYALLGHSCEMVASGDIDFQITFSALKWLPGAKDYAQRDIFPGGAGRNRYHYEPWVQWYDGLQEFQKNLLFDPQTSGGLLIAVEAEKAETLLEQLIAGGDDSSIVGEVRPGKGSIIVSP
jgi:selenide,water dikinase